MFLAAQWAEWGQWSTVFATCGSEKPIRIRQCELNGNNVAVKNCENEGTL